MKMNQYIRILLLPFGFILGVIHELTDVPYLGVIGSILRIVGVFVFPFMSPTLAGGGRKNIKRYTSGRYKKYDGGDIFANFTETSRLVEKGKISAFYYLEYYVNDSFFYGKQNDYFSLDIRLTPEAYTTVKTEQIETHGQPYIECDYQIWYWSNGNQKNTYCLGFCDISNMVKLVMVTYVHARDFSLNGNYLRSGAVWKNRKKRFVRT